MKKWKMSTFRGPRQTRSKESREISHKLKIDKIVKSKVLKVKKHPFILQNLVTGINSSPGSLITGLVDLTELLFQNLLDLDLAE